MPALRHARRPARRLPSRRNAIRRLAYSLVLLIGIAGLVAPAVAGANRVIDDCAEDGRLDRTYSNEELRRAEDELPADLDEYSDCREVIAGAISGGSDRGGGRGAGASPLTPAEQAAARAADEQALTEAASGRKKPRVQVGGKTIEPGDDGLFDLASAADGIPTPLLLALIAIGGLGLGGGGQALRDRLPALAGMSIPRPSLQHVSFPRLRR